MILDLELQHAVISLGYNVDLTRIRTRFNSSEKCIFHDRLQNEMRNPRIECFRFDIHSSTQTIMEANLFYLEVALQEFEFTPKRYVVGAGILQGQTQKVTEPRDHLVSLIHVFSQKARNRSERIEKEL